MFIDPMGTDAIVLTTGSTSVYLNGHTSVLAQDKKDNWYYFYWGNKNAVLLEVPADKVGSLKDLNSFLEANGAGKKGEETDKILHDSSTNYKHSTYIEGDFSASIDYYLKQIRGADFTDTITDKGKHIYGNDTYKTTSWNCMHLSFEGLKEGTLADGSTNFGDFVKWNGNGSVRPNDFKAMIRETFLNESMTKSAAQTAVKNKASNKKPMGHNQTYFDRGISYANMIGVIK